MEYVKQFKYIMSWYRVTKAHEEELKPSPPQEEKIDWENLPESTKKMYRKNILDLYHTLVEVKEANEKRRKAQEDEEKGKK